MFKGMDLPSLGMVAAAIFVGIVYLRSAVAAGSRMRDGDVIERRSEASERDRFQRADDARERVSALPRYGVAFVGFGMACAVLAHVVPAPVAYAILALALVLRSVADLVSEERAPRRRSAFLQRSRRVDPVFLTWICLAAGSSLFLVPYVLGGDYRAVAIVVAACVAAMSVVAWRIASAPPILLGNDVAAEQVVDHETRAIRTGNTCFVTVGAVFVFTCFVGNSPGVAQHHVDALITTQFAIGVGLYVWKTIYARHLSRTPLAS